MVNEAEYCKNSIKELEKVINRCKKCLEEAPEGSLRIINSKNRVQYYHVKEKGDTKGTYIRNGESEVAKQLAQKAYAKKMLRIVEEKKKMLESIVDDIDMSDLYKVYELATNERKKLISPYWLSDDDYEKLWIQKQLELNDSQEKKIQYEIDEELALYTERGESVRSKSEKIIADKFFFAGIPYVYELPLKLRGYGTVYPDFTVLNKRTRKAYYWEHLGMMDMEEYCNKSIKKIETYHRNGIYLGEELILTFETKDHPLNSKEVQRLVEKFLR